MKGKVRKENRNTPQQQKKVSLCIYRFHQKTETKSPGFLFPLKGLQSPQSQSSKKVNKKTKNIKKAEIKLGK